MPPSPAAQRLITALDLQHLPGEGGYFRQTWRGAGSSAIYYLMTPEAFSALHRMVQDEVWHFYDGDPVEHVRLDAASRTLEVSRLGPDVLGGDQPQVVVHAGTWQGARLAPGASEPRGFALLGCTVSPPWDDSGYVVGERDELLRALPEHAAWIRALTR